MENEPSPSSASTSTPAASKYRSRFHIKPNLNVNKIPKPPTSIISTDEILADDIDKTDQQTTVAVVEQAAVVSEKIVTETPSTSEEAKLQETPVLASLLSSPSKYRSRFQVKPNLNLGTIEKRCNNYDDTDTSVVAGPIVAASAQISQKINDPPTRTNKRRFESSRQLDRSLFTMADLIYWNPENGSALKRENEDDFQPPTLPTKAIEQKPKETMGTKEETVFAPQVRVNADGSIVIDETSLTVRTTKEDSANLELVRESNKCRNSRLTSFSFRRNPIVRPRTWSENVRSSSPLQIPKRLRQAILDENDEESSEQNESANEDVESQSDAVSVATKADEDDSEEDVDEQLKIIFKRPTRSGRLPKPVKLPEMASVEQLPKWKRKKRIDFATKVVQSLKKPKDDDVPFNPELIAPRPSKFPKYVPTSLKATPTRLENGETSRIIATDSPGQQILLVHEKSKEAGKPDLVHIYLVSSPSQASSTSSPGQLPSNFRSPIVRANDETLETSSELNAADLITRSVENEITLTVASENELALNIDADTNNDVILIDI